MNQSNALWAIGLILFIYGVFSISKLGLSINEQLANYRFVRLAMFQAHTMSSEAFQDEMGVVNLEALEVSPQFTYEIAYGVYNPESKSFVAHNGVGLMGTEKSSLYTRITGLNANGFSLPKYSQFYHNEFVIDEEGYELGPYENDFSIYTLPITYKSGTNNNYGVLVVVLYPKEIEYSILQNIEYELNDLLRTMSE